MPRRSLRRSLLFFAVSLLVLTTGPLSASALSIDLDAFMHRDDGKGARGIGIDPPDFGHQLAHSYTHHDTHPDAGPQGGDMHGDRDREARWKLDVLLASHALDFRHQGDEDDDMVWGDHSAHPLARLFADAFGRHRIGKGRFHLGGFGGHRDADCDVVPEPSTALLVGLGLIGLGLSNRRRA